METKDVSKLVLLSIQEGLSRQLSELSKYSFDGSSIILQKSNSIKIFVKAVLSDLQNYLVKMMKLKKQ